MEAEDFFRDLPAKGPASLGLLEPRTFSDCVANDFGDLGVS